MQGTNACSWGKVEKGVMRTVENTRIVCTQLTAQKTPPGIPLNLCPSVKTVNIYSDKLAVLAQMFILPVLLTPVHLLDNHVSGYGILL